MIVLDQGEDIDTESRAFSADAFLRRMPYAPAPRILRLSGETSPTVPVLSPTSRHDDASDASAAELKTLLEDAMMVMIKTTRLVPKMMSMMLTTMITVMMTIIMMMMTTKVNLG